MVGMVLLLAALGVTALLGAVLVVAVRGKLRERDELDRANRPSVPSPAAVEAVAAPRKPPLVPWLVASGVAVVVVTLFGALLIGSCRMVRRANLNQRARAECQGSVNRLAEWFFTDWEQRKALPPANAVPLGGFASCPLGHRFKYVGGSRIMVGGERLLVVELEGHEVGSDFEHGAILADPKFLDSGKTGAEYQSGTRGASGGYVYYGQFFQVRTLSENEYAAVRQAVEEAP